MKNISKYHEHFSDFIENGEDGREEQKWEIYVEKNIRLRINDRLEWVKNYRYRWRGGVRGGGKSA